MQLYVIILIAFFSKIMEVCMGSKWDKNYVKIGMVITISVCICLLFNKVLQSWRGILNLFFILSKAMTPLIIGAVIAFLLNPIMKGFQNGYCKLGMKYTKASNERLIFKKAKAPAIVSTMVLFVAFLAGFLWIVIPEVYYSIEDLINNMDHYVQNVTKWAQENISENSTLEKQLSNILDYVQKNFMSLLQDKVMPNLDTIVVQISSGVIGGIKFFVNFIVGSIVAIYFLANKEVLGAQCKKVVFCISTKSRGNKIVEAVEYMNKVFGGFINGKIIDSIIIGLICFAFCSSINMPYFLLISIIIGITNIVPFFGPFVGAIPCGILLLVADPIMFVVFVIFVIVLQTFDGYFLGPLILGDSTSLPGFWVLASILVGGNLFGFAGMLLGVPIAACIYTYLSIVLRDKLRSKNLSSATDAYMSLGGINEETGEMYYLKKDKKKKRLFFMKKSKETKNKEVEKK